MTPSADPAAFAPELVILAGAVVTLLAGSFLPRTRQWAAQLLAAATLAGALAAAIAGAGPDRTVYAGSFALDTATHAARIIIPAAALACLGLATSRVRGNARESEFYVLVLLASLGSMVLAGSSDLLLLAVGYLLASIPLYALTGWGRDPAGAEGALKIYLLGAMLGIVMLAGIAVLAGVGGGATTYAALTIGLADAPPAAVAFGLVAILAGLLFKAGAFPVHFWVPDAVDGATVPAGAFLTTVPKVGALLALYRLLPVIPEHAVHWRLLLAVVAAASMTLGNLAAYAQDGPKRLLAYSTISQVGYLLMAVVVAGHRGALPALVLYLAAYAASNLGAFAVVALLPRRQTLGSYRGLVRAHPLLAAVLVVCLLGLVGTPPTAVFAGKLTIFAATWDGGWAWLVVVAAVNTVASLYYYLRWLAPAFSAPGTDQVRLLVPDRAPATSASRAPGRAWVAAVALTTGLLALALGLGAQLVLAIGPAALAR